MHTCNFGCGAGVCSCSAGYEGETCNSICPEGTFGLDCAQKCDCYPSNNTQLCHHVTGDCMCQPNFRGVQCETYCPKGSVDSACNGLCNCMNDGSCSSDKRRCLCQRGWTGDYCEKPCSPGFYGKNCTQTCPHCLGSKLDYILHKWLCYYLFTDSSTGYQVSTNVIQPMVTVNVYQDLKVFVAKNFAPKVFNNHISLIHLLGALSNLLGFS